MRSAPPWRPEARRDRPVRPAVPRPATASGMWSTTPLATTLTVARILPGLGSPARADATIATFDAGAVAPALPLDAHDVADTVVRAVQAAHGQAMFGFARRMGLSDAEADDAVQEALTRLLAELQRGVGLRDPKAWAYQTTYRIAMDQHRLRRRAAGLLDRLARHGPYDRPSDLTDRVTVWAEVDRLPPRQRQVVYLRYRSDLTFDEIAAILGITSSAARSHATQAMQTLRRHLDEDAGDE
jgi:RNA polymerase sigma factor (sigma-70 family)